MHGYILSNIMQQFSLDFTVIQQSSYAWADTGAKYFVEGLAIFTDFCICFLCFPLNKVYTTYGWFSWNCNRFCCYCCWCVLLWLFYSSCISHAVLHMNCCGAAFVIQFCASLLVFITSETWKLKTSIFKNQKVRKWARERAQFKWIHSFIHLFRKHFDRVHRKYFWNSFRYFSSLTHFCEPTPYGIIRT